MADYNGSASNADIDAIKNLDVNSDAILKTTDLLTAYTWSINAGLMKSDDTILTGYNYDISPKILVKEGMTIKLDANGFNIYDNQATFPDILQYDNSGALSGTLLMNEYYKYASASDKAGAYTLVTIPADVKYIKICGKFTTCEIYGHLKAETDRLFDSYNNPNLNNLLIAGRLQAADGGGTTTSFSGTSVSTGFLPVSVGQTIRYRLFSTASINSVNLFDSNKNPLRVLTAHSSLDDEYEYTFNSIDDASVAYVVASCYNPDGREYFYLSGTSTRVSEIGNEVKGKADSILVNRGGVLITPYTTTTTTTNDSILVNSTPAYAYIRPEKPSLMSSGYTVPCVAVRFKLVSGTAPISVSWYNTSSSLVSNKIDNINIGDIFTIYAATLSQIKIVGGSNTLLQVIDSKSFYLHSSIGEFETIHILENMMLEKYSVVDYSIECQRATTIINELKGSSIAFFSDSVYSAFGIPELIATDFGATMTNLAQSGSTPYNTSNLSDTQLALIPANVNFVIISGGTNAYGDTPLGDITSRDVTTMEGSLNYAIDWVYTNRPRATIILGTVQYRDSATESTWNQVYRDLGKYRGIPVIDIAQNSGINPNTTSLYLYDGVHPNTLGINRLKRTWVAGIRAVIG